MNTKFPISTYDPEPQRPRVTVVATDCFKRGMEALQNQEADVVLIRNEETVAFAEGLIERRDAVLATSDLQERQAIAQDTMDSMIGWIERGGATGRNGKALFNQRSHFMAHLDFVPQGCDAHGVISDGASTIIFDRLPDGGVGPKVFYEEPDGKRIPARAITPEDCTTSASFSPLKGTFALLGRKVVHSPPAGQEGRSFASAWISFDKKM